MERKRKIVCGKYEESENCASVVKNAIKNSMHTVKGSANRKCLPYGFLLFGVCLIFEHSGNGLVTLQSLKDAVDREVILLRGVKPFQIEIEDSSQFR